MNQYDIMSVVDTTSWATAARGEEEIDLDDIVYFDCPQVSMGSVTLCLQALATSRL